MWLFTVAAGVLLVIVNTKLVHVARYVTRGGRIHRLRPGVFWLNRPWLLLPVLKARWPCCWCCHTCAYVCT